MASGWIAVFIGRPETERFWRGIWYAWTSTLLTNQSCFCQNFPWIERQSERCMKHVTDFRLHLFKALILCPNSSITSLSFPSFSAVWFRILNCLRCRLHSHSGTCTWTWVLHVPFRIWWNAMRFQLEPWMCFLTAVLRPTNILGLPRYRLWRGAIISMSRKVSFEVMRVLEKILEFAAVVRTNCSLQSNLVSKQLGIPYL